MIAGPWPIEMGDRAWHERRANERCAPDGRRQESVGPLAHHVVADVIIVGGRFAGCSVAYSLLAPGGQLRTCGKTYLSAGMSVH